MVCTLVSKISFFADGRLFIRRMFRIIFCILPEMSVQRKMDFKRVVLLSGHYGSGKTNIAVNLAFELKKIHERVAIADIDIVNPYFRTEDSRRDLEAAGIRLICSAFANTNVDLPQEVYSIVDDTGTRAIIDVGGDDRGALALGRWRDAIMEENDYEMLFVVNCFRPLTRDADSTIEVMREIEWAAKMPFTAIVNNSNLGNETTAQDVLDSQAYAREISEKTGLPIRMTAVHEGLAAQLEGKIENLFALKLQKKL